MPAVSRPTPRDRSHDSTLHDQQTRGVELTGKELVINYFPTSIGLRYGAVVPFWPVVIEEDFQVLREVVGVFAADGVDLVQQANGHSQSGAGLRVFEERLGDLHGVEEDALAGAGDVGEDLMFERIVLRAVGRIVGEVPCDLQAVRQSLQVFLEQVVCGAVASAALAQDQQARRGGVSRAAVLLSPQSEAVAAEFAGVVAGVQVEVGVRARQIGDAVRNPFAVSRAGDIVVEGFDGLFGEGLAGAVKVPQHVGPQGRAKSSVCFFVSMRRIGWPASGNSRRSRAMFSN